MVKHFVGCTELDGPTCTVPQYQRACHRRADLHCPTVSDSTEWDRPNCTVPQYQTAHSEIGRTALSHSIRQHATERPNCTVPQYQTACHRKADLHCPTVSDSTQWDKPNCTVPQYQTACHRKADLPLFLQVQNDMDREGVTNVISCQSKFTRTLLLTRRATIQPLQWQVSQPTALRNPIQTDSINHKCFDDFRHQIQCKSNKTTERAINYVTTSQYATRLLLRS
jgi:hypothetical protein